MKTNLFILIFSIFFWFSLYLLTFYLKNTNISMNKSIVLIYFISILFAFIFFKFSILGFPKIFPKKNILAGFIAVVTSLIPLIITSTKKIELGEFTLIVFSVIAEEIFFRGLIARSIDFNNTITKSVIGGIIFSLSHFRIDLGYILRASVVGTLLSWIFYETDGLLYPVLIHLFLNLKGLTR